MVDKVYNTGETEEELHKKYNPEGSNLRLAQNRMLEMMIYLDNICKSNNLEYFINDGTLLGAVRHGGFIPWDDDVDVVMTAKDIRKLKQIINNDNSQFIIQDHQTDPGFIKHWKVIRDTKSEYIIDDFRHTVRKYRGLQIDLFPYQYYVNGKLQRLLAKMNWHNENGLLGKYKLLSEIEYTISSYVMIPLFKIGNLFSKRRFVSYGYETIWDEKLPYETVFPLKIIEFEGHTFMCPNEPEECLRIVYGDYEKLAPIEERSRHKISTIVFKE